MSTKLHIDKLFEDAKAKDEFEFACTLINYKGIGSQFSRSNHYEWLSAISFYEKLYNDDQYSLHERARFALMIYCTFFESSDLYTILGNLSRVAMGYRAAPYLYWKHQKADRWFGTAEKISMVEEVLIDSGFPEIQKFFSENHFEQIRHAFFHSTYAFEDDDYIMHEVQLLYINNLGHNSLSISKFIFPRVNVIIDFFHGFTDAFETYLKSYTTDKTVIGRMPDQIPIKIIGSSEGLKGFHDSRGGSIELKNDMWMATNIRFNFPTEVDRHVNDELQRLFGKDKISTNDGALQRLYEVIIERNIQREKEDLGTVYSRFGHMFLEKANNEKNHFKKGSLYQISLSFYEKMSELNSKYKIHSEKALAKYMAGESNNNIKLCREAISDLLTFLETDFKKNVLTNVSAILGILKDKGIDVGGEKKQFIKILSRDIPTDLVEHVEKIKKDISNI